MKKIIFIAILSIAISPIFAQKAKPAAPAAPAAAPAATPPPAAAPMKKYGMAGCGLGSLVITANDITQIFAGTTNATSYSQLFGITTGTSNCTKDGIVMNDKLQEIFVHTNYENLEREAALGKGEKLDALASLMGCNGKEFSSLTKKNYEKFFAAKESSPSFLLSALKVELSNETAKAACKI
ncbi:MAG: DUF3015 family protein [Leptospiraceae bacterium]|nr:DUF3015 family protein [Leptospiraceae bacterium]